MCEYAYANGFQTGVKDGLDNNSQCPYISGSIEYNSWLHGYVDGVSHHYNQCDMEEDVE